MPTGGVSVLLVLLFLNHAARPASASARSVRRRFWCRHLSALRGFDPRVLNLPEVSQVEQPSSSTNLMAFRMTSASRESGTSRQCPVSSGPIRWPYGMGWGAGPVAGSADGGEALDGPFVDQFPLDFGERPADRIGPSRWSGRGHHRSRRILLPIGLALRSG